MIRLQFCTLEIHLKSTEDKLKSDQPKHFQRQSGTHCDNVVNASPIQIQEVLVQRCCNPVSLWIPLVCFPCFENKISPCNSATSWVTNYWWMNEAYKTFLKQPFKRETNAMKQNTRLIRTVSAAGLLKAAGLRKRPQEVKLR